MKSLTFAFDVELNDDEYIPSGTVVKVAQSSKTYKGYQAILYNGYVEHFANASFKEFR
jgi:hypothetical protein